MIFLLGRSPRAQDPELPTGQCWKTQHIVVAVSSYSEPLHVVTSFMIHWDPSQKFHFDLKCVKIPFLASEAHCFGEESWTYFVFWILLLVNIRGPEMCAIIGRRRAFAITNYEMPCPCVSWGFRIHPFSHPSPRATQNTSQITLPIFCNNRSHDQHHHPLGIGERERGGLVLVPMEP